VNIRRITDSDTDAVCALIARNLREVNSRDYSADYIEAIVRANDRGAILDRAKNAHMFVAVDDDGTILGCGAIQEYCGRQDESILLTIFVLPEQHARGIGHRIMQTLENDDYARRARRIEIHASITACEFYRKLGYDYKGGERKLDPDGCIRLEKFVRRE
jgi:N-acetylglutamate synthase-like GNAT family acetyltransferase